MQRLLVSRLLGWAAHQGHGRLRRLDWSSILRRHHHIVTIRRHRSDNRLAPQRDVQIARGSDALDGVKLHGYVAGVVRLDYELFAVLLGDRTGQAIAILQDDLIGEQRHCH